MSMIEGADGTLTNQFGIENLRNQEVRPVGHVLSRAYPDFRRL